MAKRERRGGRQAIDNWHQRALELDAELKKAKRGERDGIYREFAAKLRVSASVPRRMIQALRLLDYVRNDVAFTHLAGQMAEEHFSSLVVLDRWSQYAPDHALSAAQRLVGGEINLPMLRDLERADRANRETVLSATAGTWQTLAATRAVSQVEDMHDGARCIWAARGWRPDGLQLTSLKLPGLVNELPALPGVHLAFALSSTSEPLLVSILSDRVARARSPAVLVQIVLTLLGYTRLGCECLLLVREADAAAALEKLVASIGHPARLATSVLAFD